MKGRVCPPRADSKYFTTLAAFRSPSHQLVFSLVDEQCARRVPYLVGKAIHTFISCIFTDGEMAYVYRRLQFPKLESAEVFIQISYHSSF